MAILQKRKSVNQLPRFERYQDTRGGDRAAALRGETPITSAIRQLAGSSGYGPMADEGYTTMGDYGSRAGVTGRGGVGSNQTIGRGGAGAGTSSGRGGAGPLGGAGSALTSSLAGPAAKGLAAKGTGSNAMAQKTAGSTTAKGLTSATGAVKTAGATAGKTTGATAGKVAGTTAAGTTSKLPGLTSKTTPATTTAGKTLTSTGGTGATKTAGATTGTGTKTLTSTGSGTGTATAGTGGTKSTGSTLGKTITDALTGAAVGVAGKTLIDKITGKKTTGTGTTTGAGTTGTGKNSGTGLTSKTNPLGTDIGKKIVDTGVQKAIDTTKTGAKTVVDATKTGTKTTVPTSVLKTADTKGVATAPKTGTAVGPKTGTAVGPKAGTAVGPKAGTAGSKTAGSAAKGVTAKTVADIKAENPELTDEEVQAEFDRLQAESETYGGVPEDAVDNGDGTYSVTEDGMVTTYDANGAIIGLEAAEGETAGGGGGGGDTLDTTTETLEDGTVVTLDANGDLVSYVGTDGLTYDADGNEIIVGGEDTVVTGDGTTTGGTRSLTGGTGVTTGDGNDIIDDETGYYADDEGNVYDGDGVLVQNADGTYPDDSTEGEVAYTDEYGNTFDANGVLLEEADHSDYVSEPDEYGTTYDWDGNIVSEGDHSDYTQTDADGNVFNWDGELISYADGTTPDDITGEDGSGDDSEEEIVDEEDEEAEGGAIRMADGGDPDDEDGDPIAEEENEDGTITQYFDDGSSITYSADGDVVDVTESTDNAPLQTRSLSGNKLTTAEMQQILDDRKISRQAMERQQIEDDFNAEESLANYRAKNGLPPLRGTTSTSVPASEQNLQGKKYFSDGSYIYFDKYGTPVQTADADGNLSFYDPSKKPTVNSEATATLARDPNYSDTTEEVQDFQNVGYNFGESGNPTMTGYTSTGSRNPVGNTYTGLSDAVNTSPPEGWPEGFANNFDGTATYVNPEDGSTITIDVDNNIVDQTDANGDTVVQDNEPVTTGGLTQANQNIEYFDDGSYRETYEDGSSVIYDPTGKPFSSTDTDGNTEIANTTTYDDDGNQTISDYYGNVIKVLDPQGNVIPMGEGRINTTPITGAGGSGGTNTEKAQTVKQQVAQNKADANQDAATQDWLKSLMSGLDSYGGSALAGAVLGGLLGNQDIFGGGGNTSNQVDMSTVGKINPRTTDFGIGPANYVGYDEYGTPEAMPELYGNELYQNLNAPGFNEVNEGDYARMDAEMEGEMPGDYYDDEGEYSDDSELYGEEEGMAEGGEATGGLGDMQTYYTFGTPIDPMQNLYNPQPAPPQPQRPPQGMPPQAAQNQQQMGMRQPVMGMPPGMPQGAPRGQNMGMAKPPQQYPMQAGPQGLKSGGLPAWSNVPMTNGRLNFRNGAPVHGAGDGQSDDIPAMLADGEYVFDAETVAQIGNGSTKAGAQALDKFRENIRAHKRSAPVNKIPPKTKALTSYLRGAK